MVEQSLDGESPSDTVGAPPVLARLGLWRVTRHPAVREVYDRLATYGVVLAQLDQFERPIADATGSRPQGDPPTGVTLDVHPARDLVGSDDQLSQRLLRAHLAPGDRIVLARRDGEPVGHCCLGDRRVYVPELDRRFDPPGTYCWRLYVRPGTRGAGIGRALVAAAVRWAASGAARTDVLSALVAPDNLPSRRVFASLGFQPARRLSSIGFGRWTWRRSRRLGSASDGSIDVL